MSDEEDGVPGGDRYYAGVGEGASPARRSGWRRRIGQFARFEMALAPWDETRVESVLDLGCGTGELASYLRETDRQVDYTGIEARGGAVERARERHPEVEFLEGDLYAVELERAYDLVVAVGAHVDGRAPRSDRDRVRRIERLVERCAACADVGVSCAVLDAAAVRRRASLRSEAALFGATEEELEELGREFGGNAFTVGGLRTDRVLIGAVGADGPQPRRVDPVVALSRAADVHRNRGGAELDEAWLWLEAGAFDRARAILEATADSGERYRHLVDRLEREM